MFRAYFRFRHQAANTRFRISFFTLFELQTDVVRGFNRLVVSGSEAFFDSLTGGSGIIRFGNRVNVAVDGMIGEVIDFPSF